MPGVTVLTYRGAMAELAPEAPYDGGRLLRALSDFRTVGRSDVAFGGPVVGGGTALDITGLHGTSTRSLQGLRVRAGFGLGGKALTIGRPVSVSNYYDARGITHQYDGPVRAEQLETVTALPIVVDRVPRMVVYLAHRTQVVLGDVWYDAFLPLVRRIEREIAVDDEVRRRLAAAVPAAPSTERLSGADLRDISRELADLAGLVEDATLRARLESLRSRVERGRTPAIARQAAPTGLAAREVDVLAQVALGQSNREVAEALGLVESTVKSYLKNAMRKLHATNRVHAVRLAREAGVID